MIEDEGVQGWIDPVLAEEFPELRLWYTELETPGPASTPAVQARLRSLSDRFHGAQAITLRSRPVPHAYRVFFRHIGLDPDVEHVPVEALAIERLRVGGFRSQTLLEDALTIATLETAVPVWALDADTVTPPLGLRAAAHREPLGRLGREAWLPQGRLCVVDRDGPVAVLFGAVASGHAVTGRTRRALLFSVQVAGVPAIHVSEALWTVTDTVAGGVG